MFIRNKNSKTFIVLLIISIVALCIGIFIMLEKGDNLANVTNNTSNINSTNNTNRIENNTEENDTIEDVTNNIDTNTAPGEEIINTINVPNGSNTTSLIDDLTNEETKAVNIAKKDFGDATGYVFTYEGKDDNGKYMVCVRNKKTTEALTWYYVDINSGAFTKE